MNDDVDNRDIDAREADEWFDWALELCDELGLSRGPVRVGEDPDAWEPEQMRERLGELVRRGAASTCRPTESP